MNLVVQNDGCWICGTTENLTMHHTIPQRYKPKKNVIVPLCKKCHGIVNSGRASDLIAFTGKLFFMIRDLKDNVRKYFERDKKEQEEIK